MLGIALIAETITIGTLSGNKSSLLHVTDLERPFIGIRNVFFLQVNKQGQAKEAFLLVATKSYIFRCNFEPRLTGSAKLHLLD